MTRNARVVGTTQTPADKLYLDSLASAIVLGLSVASGIGLSAGAFGAPCSHCAR